MSRYPAGRFGASAVMVAGGAMGIIGALMVILGAVERDKYLFLFGWGFIAVIGGMLLLSLAAVILAIFDIADRYLAEPEKIAEEPEPEPEPEPELGPEPEPEAQRPPAMPYGITDMDESTARRIAEEDERKFKGKQ